MFTEYLLCVVQSLSHVQLFATSQTVACQASLSFTTSQSLPKFTSIELVMLSPTPTITSSAIPFSFCLQSFLISESFPVSQLFQSGGQSIRVSASATVLPVLFRVDFLQFDLLVIQETQESSPALQFESIYSLVLSLLYGPTFTSVHDYWKNHRFDYTDPCWRSDISDFKYAVQVCHSFPSREQASFSFMAALTVCSDFGTQENKICHYLHFLSFYLP